MYQRLTPFSLEYLSLHSDVHMLIHEHKLGPHMRLLEILQMGKIW